MAQRERERERETERERDRDRDDTDRDRHRDSEDRQRQRLYLKICAYPRRGGRLRGRCGGSGARTGGRKAEKERARQTK
eukprot:2209214-Rhodomonas_salina.2